MPHENITHHLAPPEEFKDVRDRDLLHMMLRFRYRDSFGILKPQRLTSLGTHHSRAPEHWYYPLTAALFKEWEEETRDRPRIMVAEGYQDLWRLGATPEQAIQDHYSEVGLMCFWAEKYDIPIVSGEPPHYAEIGQLMLEFPPEEVLAHYGIIAIPIINRPSLDEYMEEDVFPSYQRKLGKLALTLPASHPLHGFDFSYQHFRKVHTAYFNEAPVANDPKWNEFYLSVTSPELESAHFARSAVARVAKRRRELRDSHLGARLTDYWQAGRNIFTWYGIYHTLSLEPYLKKFGHPLLLNANVRFRRTPQEGYLIDPQEVPRQLTPEDQSPLALHDPSPRDHLPPPLALLDGYTFPYPSVSRLQAHLQQRVTEPINCEAYMAQLLPPYPWKADLSELYQSFEEIADDIFFLLRPPYSDIARYIRNSHNFLGFPDSNHDIFRHFDNDSQSQNTFLAACFRVNQRYCHEETESYLLNQRLTHLFETILATTADVQQATLVFDTISKHLVALEAYHRSYFLFNHEFDIVTAVERLQYYLDLLDYDASCGHAVMANQTYSIDDFKNPEY